MSGITKIVDKIIESPNFNKAVKVQDKDALRIFLIDAFTATYLATASKCAKTYGRVRFDKLTPREMKSAIRNSPPPDETDYLIP